MNVFPKSHIDQIKSRPDAFWHNGPPPEVAESEQVPGNAGWFYAQKAVAFLVSLERTHSIRASKTAVSMDNFTYTTLAERSAWFCESINRLAAEMTHEIRLTAHVKAVGYTEAAEDGSPVTDASGRVVHRGGSVPLTLALLEASPDNNAYLRPDGFSDPLPLLPSNVDQQRQLQINNLHRSLLALQPACDAGDRQAIDTQIKLQDQLSKLQGTHAAVKKEVTYNADGSMNLSRLSDAELLAAVAGGLTLTQQPDGTYVAAPSDES